MAQYIYRTKDGKGFFQFSVEQQKDFSFLAFIERMPEFEERRTDPHLTHRMHDYATDRYYIDAPCRVTSHKQMQIVMQYWAENIQRYIRTGEPFEQWHPVWQDA